MEVDEGTYKSLPGDRQSENKLEHVPTPKRKQNKWFVILAAMLLVALLVGGILFSMRSTDKTQTAVQHAGLCILSSAQLHAHAGLRYITAISSNNIWTTGFVSTGNLQDEESNMLQDSPLVEHWDGIHWNSLPLADTTALLNSLTIGTNASVNKAVSLNSLAAVSANDIWAAGSVEVSHFSQDSTNSSQLGHTLIEHWDGKHWQLVPSPDGQTPGDNTLEAITAISPNDIWAIGHTQSLNGQVSSLIERWDGSRWTLMQLPGSFPALALTTIKALSVNDVWVFGSTLSVDNSINSAPSPLAVHWDGHNWNSVSFPSSFGNSVRGVAVLSAHNIWTVGSGKTNTNTQSATIPMIMHWDGQQWNKVAEAKGVEAGSSLSGLLPVDPMISGWLARQPSICH